MQMGTSTWSIPDKFNTVFRPVEAAPLAVFRIFFGLLMLFGIIRFASYGWIYKLYIQPEFFFSYYGFEWIKPLGNLTYALFILCGISAFFIALGYKYKWSVVVFFLSFTYIELMDKTTYLNHYYLTSILAFLMIFLPANAYFSLDAYLDPKKAFQKIPAWTINSIKLLVCIVYFYAGLAKLNSDWLFKAMPMSIWLPSKFDIPLLGDFFHLEWVAYAFSWAGMIYDLAIPFLLLNTRTRPFAFITVVIFHLLTWMLFPIGMFPYVMIASTLIFFDARPHRKLLALAGQGLRISGLHFDNGRERSPRPGLGNFIKYGIVVIFFVIQFLFPFRYWAYPGELFWTEEGYRFSWRVMLIEKSGYAQFRIVNGDTGSWFYVDNTDFLTPFQEKQMAFQSDFMLEYAHFLKDHFEKEGHRKVEVYVESRVSLNGRLSTPLIDPGVDLGSKYESFRHKDYILPFNDVIKGL